MLGDHFQLALVNLLPKKTISRLVGGFARSVFSKPLVPLFARQYKIDLDQALHGIEDYPSLTAFFTRELKHGLRPVVQAENLLASPVDGVVSQAGTVDAGTLVQAKGVNYTVLELLGQDLEMARRFDNGTFFTIYLSPRDYHRIHSPIRGRVLASAYIPGTLFPVNPFGVRAVKGLFARNERLITYLDSTAGLVALVKVGSTIVGSVKVNYAAVTTNLPGAKPEKTVVEDGPLVAKGDEIGRFEFGSTVIVLFEAKVEPKVAAGERVLLGQAIAELTQ